MHALHKCLVAACGGSTSSGRRFGGSQTSPPSSVNGRCLSNGKGQGIEAGHEKLGQENTRPRPYHSPAPFFFLLFPCSCLSDSHPNPEPTYLVGCFCGCRTGVGAARTVSDDCTAAIPQACIAQLCNCWVCPGCCRQWAYLGQHKVVFTRPRRPIGCGTRIASAEAHLSRCLGLVDPHEVGHHESCTTHLWGTRFAPV
jgi:hypothetical protein